MATSMTHKQAESLFKKIGKLQNQIDDLMHKMEERREFDLSESLSCSSAGLEQAVEILMERLVP